MAATPQTSTIVYDPKKKVGFSNDLETSLMQDDWIE